ncbi:MAG: hypothetical protein LBU32_02470, partial [Clostridiales bacterium]|nr:hypothetical protein [Clostridiales bacterium]
PNFRYDVFNVNGISKAKLMEMEGALRLIFLLDQEIGNDLGELPERHLYVDQEAGKLGNDEKIVVAAWIKEVIRIKYFNEDKTRFDKFVGKGRNIMAFYQEYWPEAWQEGKKEGIAETEREKAESLAEAEREKAEYGAYTHIRAYCFSYKSL